jgi:hypothetical protein
MSAPSYVTSQGVSFSWGSASGGLSIEPTSISVDASVQDTIDITSMASGVRYDEDNSDKPFVIRDIDSAFAANAGYEVSVEFYASRATMTQRPLWQVGKMRKLRVGWADPDSSSGAELAHLDEWAVLKTINWTSTVGEFVSGSATFVVSGSPYMTQPAA